MSRATVAERSGRRAGGERIAARGDDSSTAASRVRAISGARLGRTSGARLTIRLSKHARGKRSFASKRRRCRGLLVNRSRAERWQSGLMQQS